MQPLDAGDPQTVGAYRILGRLGAGGMGRVYLGRSAGGRTVAVKVAHPHFALDEEFRARFRREVAAARQVGGDWTAPVLDADPDATVPWVATGYVAGPTLTEAVADSGPLPAYAVRALGAGLAEALTAVHGLALVHRDVKPSNVMLTLDGPRLIDFGIARATDGTASLTSTGVSIGSPGYMSPEQILSKDVTGAADVFSLGAVLAYAALGEAPFPGDSSAALLYKVVHEEPRLDGLDALDSELREVVAACLAKEAVNRPSPEEVARRLAPGGAARLVAAGWLPGPLVERAGRAAVRLLDLEPASAPPGASGPVPFSSPAVGTFGPPPASFGSGAAAAAVPVVPAPRRDAHGDAHGEATATATDPAGRLSFSLTTMNTPDDRGRGRRRSCTVVLAVAGALAVATVGGSIYLGGLDGLGGDNAGADKGGDHDTGAAPPPGVPDSFTGTWEGSITAGGVASQYSVKISDGETGDDVARTTNTFGPLRCNGLGELDSATAKTLRITDRADPARPSTPGCASSAVQVTYTLEKDGTLTVRAEGKGTGNPAGTLRRLGR